MAEEPEPTLPRLPPSFMVGDRRKRGRATEPPPLHESSTSSDPAFFSSDDDPALDNYQAQGRHKRRYVGTWFDQQPASSDSALGDESLPRYLPPRRNRTAPRPQKREFRRQLDSGVWMSMDGASSDMDEVVDLNPTGPRFRLPPPQDYRPMSEQELQVSSIIRACIEEGKELVDISHQRLSTIPDGLLDPIRHIVPIPNVVKDVNFEQREAQIRVLLSGNRIEKFPISLLNVENLVEVSLRANDLKRLPPQIAQLSNLDSLHIGGNDIPFLPGEMLQLLKKGTKLERLYLHPNPFWRPRAFVPLMNTGAKEYELLTFGPTESVQLPPRWQGKTTKLECRSPVQFMDSSNRTRSDFVLLHHGATRRESTVIDIEPFTELATPRKLDMARLPHHMATSKGARSLFEMVLRRCANVPSTEAKVIRSWLHEERERLPPHLEPSIERAFDLQGDGGIKCSVCGKDTVMPLAQWIEFREIGDTMVLSDKGEETVIFNKNGYRTEPSPVPFLRVGCSWKCIPVKVELAEVEVENEDD
ncbi:hypothetical protein N0V88_003772 [Collariella sp. IMI 366227]|nr:hypothetical protein N0V88_003772 [Collariella sp. IMI 366227]